ncbi:NADP-dependent phosphogluconate dehydrogenase [Draconibacterium halophilum]|uniref:6-phosphogluconate dehydrogenase, decarboxylating n=1 Tax=Draconibacterium halophilum TaxID=2706887 RepID=A0A6C0RGX4_9BACT|nr:NADP-dependent phosphogluconate dehydrogenase [Draconibacterium halophilum]QIA09082.1 NADP-dependent phosphogluconate dehydrogenase [Draconibacterium halophilum]
MEKYDFGLIGLGVMGRNFILNIAENGHSAIGYDLDKAKVDALNTEANEFKVKGVTALKDFISGLAKPRKIMLLVPANVVDKALDDLLPFLEKDDLLIDGGNSHPNDTERREKEIVGKGFRYLGVGISGGSEGARHGPSLMPGGNEKSYKLVRPIFTDAAAKVKGDACVTWLGKGSAGHFVKMVHNGIEYGIMQLISEIYDVMKNGLSMENSEMSAIFKKWNKGLVASYLVEITADILEKKDKQQGGYLIDHILDSAKQKGTGKWTSQFAMDFQAPMPTIDTAVSMRHLSTFKTKRLKADATLKGPVARIEEDKATFIEKMEHALFFGMLMTYAQGFELLRIASNEKDFGLNLGEVARIWRGGCIIRSAMLDDFMKAYERVPQLPNLLFDTKLSSAVNKKQEAVRDVTIQVAKAGLPIPGLMASVGYFDAYRSGNLASNMIQAQRDYFGSHSYQRIGEEGAFHTEW